MSFKSNLKNKQQYLWNEKAGRNRLYSSVFACEYRRIRSASRENLVLILTNERCPGVSAA